MDLEVQRNPDNTEAEGHSSQSFIRKKLLAYILALMMVILIGLALALKVLARRKTLRVRKDPFQIITPSSIEVLMANSRVEDFFSKLNENFNILPGNVFSRMPEIRIEREHVVLALKIIIFLILVSIVIAFFRKPVFYCLKILFIVVMSFFEVFGVLLSILYLPVKAVMNKT